MSDILRRLREPDPNWSEYDVGDLVTDAADEIERLKRYIGSYVEVAQQYKRELDECRTLLDRVFRDPGPVCETAGTHTDFAYFWRTDWLKLKADYEAARAAGGE